MKFCRTNAGLAQSAERVALTFRIKNHKVAGSTPAFGFIFLVFFLGLLTSRLDFICVLDSFVM